VGEVHLGFWNFEENCSCIIRRKTAKGRRDEKYQASVPY